MQTMMLRRIFEYTVHRHVGTPMSLLNKLPALLAKTYARCTAACQNLQEFQQRIWVVSIKKNSSEQGALLNDTFVVSEDSFSSPMSWMQKRGYDQAAISRIDKMQRSQVVTVFLESGSHSLMRVK